MPPEACSVSEVKKGYSGKAADIWGLGVTFFCFIFLEVPFNGDSLPDILANISKAEYFRINHIRINFPTNRSTSEGMQEFLKFMLQKDVHERPTIT